MSRYLVVGAGGYIGSEIMAELKLRGLQCLGLSSQRPASCADVLTAQNGGVLGVRQSIEEFAPTNLIFLSAVKEDSLLLSLTPDQVQRHFEINFSYYIEIVKVILPAMMKAKDGAIVYVASSKASFGEQGTLAYAATKAAACSATKTIAAEYGRYNIRANNIFLGYFGGPMWDAIPRASREKLEKEPLLRRLGTVHEAVKFILGISDSSYMTRQDVFFDGGLRG